MINIATKNMINFLQEIIKCKSVSGEEEKVALRILEEMKEVGFDECWIDAWGNVIGRIKGKNSNTKILFDAHIDTVDAKDADKWTYPPFAGTITEDKVYGRGASDMKGALAAMLYAGKEIIKEKDKLNGDVYIAGIVYEEIFEGVSFGKVIDEVKPDYVIIGEASELDLKIGQRGRAEIQIKTYGKNAHSSNPKEGINAVYAMTKLIEKLKSLNPPVHEKLGEGILELTDIISSPYPGASVVPHLCQITLDRRLLTGETEESVLRELKRIIEELSSADPTFKAEICYAYEEKETYTGEKISDHRFFPAWLMEEDSEIVQKAYAGLQKSGLSPKISTYSFCTDGSQSAGVRAIPTIGFGPSEERLAHIVDEYVEINHLNKAALGYYHIIKELLAIE